MPLNMCKVDPNSFPHLKEKVWTTRLKCSKKIIFGPSARVSASPEAVDHIRSAVRHLFNDIQIPEVRSNGRVSLTPTQRSELGTILSKPALDRLTVADYYIYYVLLRNLGALERNSVFKIVGLSTKPTAEERQKVAYRIAVAWGNHLAELAVAAEFYKNTWKHTPVYEPESHSVLFQSIPDLYKISCLLMSSSPLLKEKDLEQAICASHNLRGHVHRIHDALILRTHIESRRQWLNELWFTVEKAFKACQVVVGTDARTTLLNLDT